VFFPPGTDALIRGYEDLWMEKMLPPMAPLCIPRTYAQLNAASQPYFRSTREAFWGLTLEEMAPADKQAALWTALERALDRFDGYTRGPGTFVAGERMTYADVLMAGWLLWVKYLFGEESKEWKQVESWHGGRWGRLMTEFKKIEYTEDKAPPK
jgi:glutathione S-transferase